MVQLSLVNISPRVPLGSEVTGLGQRIRGVPWQTHRADRAVEVQVEDGVLVSEGAIAFVKHARAKPDGPFARDFDFMQVHFRIQVVPRCNGGKFLNGWASQSWRWSLRRPYSVDGGTSCWKHRQCRRESHPGKRTGLP